MEANQILQANLLDIVFENRNKAYGAYELRKNYAHRTLKALAVSLGATALIIAMVAFTPKEQPPSQETGRIVEIENYVETPKPVEQLPPPVRQETPPPTQSEKYTEPILTDDDVVEPIPTKDDLEDSRISTVTQDGPADVGIAQSPSIADDGGKDIMDVKKKPDEPATIVQVQAAFKGNWMRFLENNLRGDVPVENGAPAGNHKVLIQFVVDLDGSISQIVPLTSAGYGMEQEAIRVIKKAGNWTPAIQAGIPVKAYRVQSITFQISGE